MPKTKLELLLTAALIAIVAGLAWWIFFGPTPKQKFLKEVRNMVEVVNAGNHGRVQEKFSPEFVRFLGNAGYQPTQIVMIVRQVDLNQNAQYSVNKLSLFEEGKFAEVEFIRKSPDGDQLFTLPFIYRDGNWWITDHFRSEKTWEGLPAL